MRNVVGVLVLVLAVGCGARTGGDCFEEKWEEADELNRKGANNGEGTCNVCTDECGEGTFWGVWLVVDETEGKRLPGEDYQCELQWGEVQYGEQDGVRNDLCPDAGK